MRSCCAKRSAVQVPCTARSGLLRRYPNVAKHIRLTAHCFGQTAVIGAFFLAAIKAAPYFVPIAARCGFGIFGGAGFEEVGVLDAVEQWR